jgi:hypothetical protein
MAVYAKSPSRRVRASSTRRVCGTPLTSLVLRRRCSSLRDWAPNCVPAEIVHHAVRQIDVTYLSQRLPVGNVVLHHLRHGGLRQAADGGVPLIRGTWPVEFASFP